MRLYSQIAPSRLPMCILHAVYGSNNQSSVFMRGAVQVYSINQVKLGMVTLWLCATSRSSAHDSIIPLSNQRERSKPSTLRFKAKLILLIFRRLLTSILSSQSSLLYSYLSLGYISLFQWLLTLTHTLPKPNPRSDYHIMLMPYYQNGSDLGFVVVKD